MRPILAMAWQLAPKWLFYGVTFFVGGSVGLLTYCPAPADSPFESPITFEPIFGVLAVVGFIILAVTIYRAKLVVDVQRLRQKRN